MRAQGRVWEGGKRRGSLTCECERIFHFMPSATGGLFIVDVFFLDSNDLRHWYGAGIYKDTTHGSKDPDKESCRDRGPKLRRLRILIPTLIRYPKQKGRLGLSRCLWGGGGECLPSSLMTCVESWDLQGERRKPASTGCPLTSPSTPGRTPSPKK